MTHTGCPDFYQNIYTFRQIPANNLVCTLMNFCRHCGKDQYLNKGLWNAWCSVLDKIFV